MNQETAYLREGNFRRVTKPNAKAQYDKGQKIWLVPAHVRFSFDNQWVRPFEMDKTTTRADNPENPENADFDNRVNSYEYYNCVSELGTYTKFYIKLEEKKDEER